MDSFDFFNHLLNFFAPALGMALLVPTLARVFWRRALQRAAWATQVGWVLAANAVVMVLGLLALGHDGAMWTYVALVLVSALGVWWTGMRGG